jgi:plastocyanin
MTRTRSLALLAALALAAVLPAQAAVPKLTGTVGPGFTMSLKKAGVTVKTTKAGKYTLTVADRSAIHNFRLRGPGVNVATSVTGTGTRTFTVTLKRGATYRFLCDPHPTSMVGDGPIKAT